MKILALDLGKNKSVFCDYHAETAEHRFGKINTIPAEMQALLLKQRPDRVVIEIGNSAGWVYDLAVTMGIDIQVAEVGEESWRWRKRKTKTDRVDALKLARVSAMNQLPTVHMPSPAVRQWRSLIQYRQSLVGRRTKIKNTIRSLLESQGLKMPSGWKAWTEAGVKQLQERALPMAEASETELWRGMLDNELKALQQIQEQLAPVEAKLDGMAQTQERVRLLRSVPGVGPRLAETVVAMIDDPKRFTRGKQVGCYAGLTPRQWQSGQMDRQGHISGRGNRVLRSMLIEVSWLGLRNNPWMKAIYERTLKGGKRKKVAIVAVARRLLVVLWAMLRDGTAWNPELAMAE
jgi:transposase